MWIGRSSSSHPETKRIERKTLPSQRELNCAKVVICIICTSASSVSHLHFPQSWLQLPKTSFNQGGEHLVRCLQERYWPIVLGERSCSFIL